MNADDSDSLWLQKSIHMSDPIPEANERTNSNLDSKQDGQPTASKVWTDPEIELTKTPFSITSMRPLHCPSQRLSARLSVSNTAFASFQELDDLRARVSQMTRERLKWSNVQRDLELARFELAQANEELKTMREYVKTMKGDLDEANSRADREVKVRHTLEMQLKETMGQWRTETEFLKQQLDDIKAENAQRLTEMADRTDLECNSRTETLREQVVKLSEELEELEARSIQVEQERAHLHNKNEDLREHMNDIRAKYEESRRSLEEYSRRCTELEKMHAGFVEETEKSHADALHSHITLSEERVRQITTSKENMVKDLRQELQAQKEKSRALSDELASLRYRHQIAEEESNQQNLDHVKEIKRLEDEHRLALCQQQLQTETLLRETKGGILSMEEERSSLRRQLSRTSEELSTVTTILAQREKHISHLEKELAAVKEAALTMQQEHISISKEAEAAHEALNHAEERVRRLMARQDTSDADYSRDLREVKEQLTSTQEELVRVRSELASAAQEKMRHEVECRGIISELRANLEEARCDKGAIQQITSEKKRADELVEEYRGKYLSMCKRAENLDIELSAASNRCTLLEKRLDEELRRSIRNASCSPTPQRQNCVNKRLRSPSSFNVPLSVTTHPTKRSRSVEPRVFTISGFDASDLLSQIKQLPHATVAECRSNTPVPSNLTHLVTNGQLTIKLLTALVRGCWILPDAYVHESLRNQRWLDESAYGFRHEVLPLSQQRIGFTEGFVSSRHYNTAKLIIDEGGATVESELRIADIVLCIHSELDSLGGIHAMTWDKLVELIYPVKIGDTQ
ncbi:hypothetical protein TraAM80_07862 [Trypanosoma rangeli]|uniref:BRCT domain-containing protein n=1 Tax=Trypanosoma rangeli TaxID=5698 RepID=A0A3S5IQG3_TRYRA|nr:uncharacterized protein TraAM80_07862 [Trypanosoma rangeli]RNE99997.1 hypothetical protein TraAM80_07862 [Trypanosoma rangeli]|eukprot:RNE99997.1 hypothetical protein TraAM80_07862 [Trypanosoma rangeli]